MQIIEMRTANVDISIGHSSKGNQLKWEQDGWWYKADAFGYESLAEVVVSRLLLQSSIQKTVVYEPVLIRYKGKEYMFALNGQTGKIVGTLPISSGKVLAWFGGITAAVYVLLTIIGGILA